MKSTYRELVGAIEDAEMICSLVDELGQDVSENNVAHKHIYGALCERATDKVTTLIRVAMQYNEALRQETNEKQSAAPTS